MLSPNIHAAVKTAQFWSACPESNSGVPTNQRTRMIPSTYASPSSDCSRLPYAPTA